ncbi:hypothetical protein CBR_g30874 [Chara braunii]|uniref:Reverse transcriptase domain-containing protein n=1 Tax=Chara braunii TaxID=69332 RepID=A0A388LDM6_CHABU|nr:hypothetical protein CBR_g30874 [Chara braunii]|eukprot:GBG80409.1 hypothetical protein CBR_g30874 [Chara braunii]
MSGSDTDEGRVDDARLTRSRSLRVPRVFQTLQPGDERRLRAEVRARALAAARDTALVASHALAAANATAREQAAAAARAAAMATAAASSAIPSSGTQLEMPPGPTGTSRSVGSGQSTSQMAGSQFSPLTPRGRELQELQQVERIHARLERELKQATDREKEIKNRTARPDTLEADKAALEGLDESSMSDQMKVLKASILSLHAHVDSRLDFMQNSLDQILDLLQKPGLRPTAQSPLPGDSYTITTTNCSTTGTAARSMVPKDPNETAPCLLRGEEGRGTQHMVENSSNVGRAKRTLQEEEVITAASYLEGKAAKWLDGIVAKVGFGRRMADWGETLTLEEFLDMVEARWHNPQQAQIATDARLDQRKYKSVRELTTTVENLVVVPGIRYDDQVLLTMFLRCLPENLRTLLASEARLEYHSFETFSRKALDLEATLGSAQPTPTDGRKKKSPQEWKKKGSRLMMVESDGTQTEIDELSNLMDNTEYDGEETAEGSTLASVVKTKAGGRGKGHQKSQGQTASNQAKVVDWVKAGLDQEVWRTAECVVLALTMVTDTPSTSARTQRGLNAITVKNAKPLPRIDDLLDRVQGCKYYSKIDLKSGYHQIAIRPEDQHKTAFQTRYSLYEFVVMPFGLCNAPGTFQHAMNRIFHDYLDKFVVVYLDDILIYSKSVKEHAQHVETVLSLLRQHKYKVNLEKCEFGRTRILYLGHEVSAEGIRLEDAKVASIRDWPRPQTVTEVRSFLGMCGYYRNFVENYSTAASPLTDLTRLDTPWDWNDECEAAFKRLKHALMNHEVLMVPDPQKPFIVTTDASQYGIGAVLAQ